MVTAAESRLGLTLVTGAAAAAAVQLVRGLEGSPEAQRATLLEAVPAMVGYYSDGSSALAADYYEDAREAAEAPGLYVVEPVVVDRTEKLLNAVAWAAAPLFSGLVDDSASRLSGVVQLEAARPYRDTILENRRRDPAAVGWRRVSSGGCKMCQMLASRGAVYTDRTARFASHENCNCTAQPVFSSEDVGEEASVMQYLASRKHRSPEQRARVREYLNTNFAEFHG